MTVKSASLCRTAGGDTESYSTIVVRSCLDPETLTPQEESAPHKSVHGVENIALDCVRRSAATLVDLSVALDRDGRRIRVTVLTKGAEVLGEAEQCIVDTLRGKLSAEHGAFPSSQLHLWASSSEDDAGVPEDHPCASRGSWMQDGPEGFGFDGLGISSDNDE